ncbi:hypothetical protein [Bradyrhizobium ottawaense]|uniref:hypothetical protein n=1 Tax=Bradyrhizobium ottawaense TaxID=931866 RepID=UPI003515C25C
MNIDLAAVLTKFQNISPGAFVKLDISIEGGSFGIFVEEAAADLPLRISSRRS